MIKNFNQWRLNESLASARARFLKPGLVDQSTFDQLKALDPTPTFKYLDKIIEFFISGTKIDELEKTISRFHMLLGKNQVKTRDINAFKTFDQLRSETQSSETQYASKQETKAREKDYDLVHEDQNWIVVIPRTEDASCKYGAGTKWCTSGEENNQYKNYTRSGITLYYIISKDLPKKDRLYKMAVAVGPNGGKECFDSRDKGMQFKDVLEISGLDPSLFVSSPNKLTPYEQLDLDESKITRNPDGSIDYDGDVMISGLGLQRIPVNFRRVGGYFNCAGNNLTSLEGAPNEISGRFSCSFNNLTSLEGAPAKVGGSFWCSHNNLTSLGGAPKEVGGDFSCNDNRLTSLEGAPEEVGGDFNCAGNNLTSLGGAPVKVGGDFNCAHNNLTSLEGAPVKVGEGFGCNDNNLTSLEGAPREVGGSFWCSNNNLTSLEGAPKEVGGDFICAHNNLTSLEGAPVKVGEGFWSYDNNLPESEKQWARENIKASRYEF